MQQGQVEVETANPVNTRAVALVARALDYYETRQQQYSHDRGNEPREGSPFSLANAYLGRLPMTLATQLDMLARDHLRTVQAVLASGLLPTWSVYSLARVAVEASARSWWMLAPDNSEDRIARAIMAKLEMLRERRLLEGGAGNAQVRIDELVTEANKSGLTVTPNEKGRPTKVHGQGYTNNTDVLSEMLPTPGPDTGIPLGEFLYRLLSAATHGNDWMVLTHAEQHGPFGDDGYGLVRAAGSPAQVTQVVMATVHAHVAALDRWCEMCGWPKFSTQPFYLSGVDERLRNAVSILSDER